MLFRSPIQYRIVYVRGGVKQTNILENEIDPFTESDYTYTYSINGGLSKGAKSSKTLSAEDIEFNAEGYRMLQILYPEDYMLTLQEDWHSMRREVKIAMLFILIMFFFIILWMVLIIRGSKERSSDVHTESLVLLLMGGAFVYVWMQANNHSLFCYPHEGFETISCIYRKRGV